MPLSDAESPCSIIVIDHGIRVTAASEQRIFVLLFEQHGPLVDVDKTWKLLGFNSRDAFNRAINQQRVPLRVIRPSRRKQSFVATAELASYLALLASASEEKAM
jgi:hypothetical protein